MTFDGLIAQDVLDAQAFLEKYPSPFTIQEVEDDEERERLLDRYVSSRNITEWAKKNCLWMMDFNIPRQSGTRRV